MTQIERYRHLLNHWKVRAEDARQELALAGAEVTKWRDKLYAAEIAEQLAKGDEL
jgi:hypothetical protein